MTHMLNRVTIISGSLQSSKVQHPQYAPCHVACNTLLPGGRAIGGLKHRYVPIYGLYPIVAWCIRSRHSGRHVTMHPYATDTRVDPEIGLVPQKDWACDKVNGCESQPARGCKASKVRRVVKRRYVLPVHIPGDPQSNVSSSNLFCRARFFRGQGRRTGGGMTMADPRGGPGTTSGSQSLANAGPLDRGEPILRGLPAVRRRM